MVRKGAEAVRLLRAASQPLADLPVTSAVGGGAPPPPPSLDAIAAGVAPAPCADAALPAQQLQHCARDGEEDATKAVAELVAQYRQQEARAASVRALERAEQAAVLAGKVGERKRRR
eukprot:gene53186-61988_t